MSYLSLTSWSLHRSLGPLQMNRWDTSLQRVVTDSVAQPTVTPLTDLPNVMASHGIGALDICHFHFPDTSPAYLAALRESLAQAGVTFDTLLIDYGDISSSDSARRTSDVAFIESWIDVAQKVGAKRVRVVAGEAPAEDRAALVRSAEALAHLIAYADARGVGVITENFRALSATADNCLYLVNACHQKLGLIADFGNCKAANKLAELTRILPAAVEVHAKGQYDAYGMPDAPELRSCLSLLAAADFNGPITLVYDGPGDEWAGIGRVQAIVEEYL